MDSLRYLSCAVSNALTGSTDGPPPEKLARAHARDDASADFQALDAAAGGGDDDGSAAARVLQAGATNTTTTATSSS